MKSRIRMGIVFLTIFTFPGFAFGYGGGNGGAGDATTSAAQSQITNQSIKILNFLQVPVVGFGNGFLLSKPSLEDSYRKAREDIAIKLAAGFLIGAKTASEVTDSLRWYKKIGVFSSKQADILLAKLGIPRTLAETTLTRRFEKRHILYPEKELSYWIFVAPLLNKILNPESTQTDKQKGVKLVEALTRPEAGGDPARNYAFMWLAGNLAKEHLKDPPKPEQKSQSPSAQRASDSKQQKAASDSKQQNESGSYTFPEATPARKYIVDSILLRPGSEIKDTSPELHIGIVTSILIIDVSKDVDKGKNVSKGTGKSP